jgi:predicted nucleic acid-binding protein
MSILADTNILLCRSQPGRPNHQAAIESVATLLAAAEAVYFTPQSISELWSFATRPTADQGLGFPVPLMIAELENIERFLTVLPDSPAVYGEWKRLVARHGVVGNRAHDARLVATMHVHGIRRILTFNIDNFAHYDIEAVHPSSLLG